MRNCRRRLIGSLLLGALEAAKELVSSVCCSRSDGRNDFVHRASSGRDHKAHVVSWGRNGGSEPCIKITEVGAVFHGQCRRSSVFCLEYVEGEGQRAIALTDGRQQTGSIGIRIRRTKEEGDAVFDEGGKNKLGTIDRVTPVSIAVAVASASVLASAWSEVVTKTKKKKGGVKVLVKSTTKGDVSAFASLAKETNGDFSWW